MQTSPTERIKWEELKLRAEMIRVQQEEEIQMKMLHAQRLAAERRATSYMKLKVNKDDQDNLINVEIGYWNKFLVLSKEELLKKAGEGDILCSMVIEKIAADKLLDKSEPTPTLIVGDLYGTKSVDTSSMSFEEVKELLYGKK